MIRRRIANSQTVYDFLSFSFEEDLEVIVDGLSSFFTIKLIEKIEGPGTIIWQLQMNNLDFSLVNNSWGNFLKPLTNDSIELIEGKFEALSHSI